MRPFPRRPALAVVVCILIACAGCSLSLPRVHKVTVQQGNVITQQMVDRLKPGMTKSQVAFVMGEPVLRHTFDDNRWDYVYLLNIPGYYDEEKRVSLFFQNGVLAYLTGDYAPSAAPAGEGAPAAGDEAPSAQPAAAPSTTAAGEAAGATGGNATAGSASPSGRDDVPAAGGPANRGSS